MTTPTRILVADALAEAGVEILRTEAQVTVETGMSPQRLIETIPEYDALVVRSATRVSREVLEAGRRLRAVARAGVGVDNIDVDACSRQGVVVVNAPYGNVVSAAEHTVGMLLALVRKIAVANDAL